MAVFSGEFKFDIMVPTLHFKPEKNQMLCHSFLQVVPKNVPYQMCDNRKSPSGVFWGTLYGRGELKVTLTAQLGV